MALDLPPEVKEYWPWGTILVWIWRAEQRIRARLKIEEHTKALKEQTEALKGQTTELLLALDKLKTELKGDIGDIRSDVEALRREYGETKTDVAVLKDWKTEERRRAGLSTRSSKQQPREY